MTAAERGQPGERPLAGVRVVDISTSYSGPTAAMYLADMGASVLKVEALAGDDTLSASQVVRRLESLEPDVLRAVQRHESSHRNRRTILNRAQQLLEGAGPDRPTG